MLGLRPSKREEHREKSIWQIKEKDFHHKGHKGFHKAHKGSNFHCDPCGLSCECFGVENKWKLWLFILGISECFMGLTLILIILFRPFTLD